MYILTYEGVFSLNKEWEKEDERKKETTQITNTARTFDIRQHSSPVRGPQRGSVQPQLSFYLCQVIPFKSSAERGEYPVRATTRLDLLPTVQNTLLVI